MGGIKIIKLNEIEVQPLPGVKGNEGWEKAGWVKRIIYPPNIITKGTFFGVGEINPGYSPHGWHTHTRFKSDLYEVVYPKDFEEVYYIISGSGIVQWKTGDGSIQEKKVGAGDTIIFSAGSPEHAMFNNGDEKIVMVFCGSPTAKVTLTR